MVTINLPQLSNYLVNIVINMARFVKQIIILPLIYITMVYGDCSKNKGCLGNNSGYSFSMDSRLFPNLDSININDTLWLEIRGPVVMLDNQSGQMINYSNAANLGTVVGLNELLGNSNFRGAFNDFNLYLKNGTNVSNNFDPLALKEYLFSEVNNEYIFLLGLIPQKIGIYRVGFGNAANVYRRNDGCSKSGFSFAIKNTNCHAYYNNQNFGITNTDSSRLYCFKVK